MEILYSGGNFPDATVAVTKEVPPDIRKRITDVFLNMDGTAEGRDVLKKFGAQRFIPSPPSDYADVIRTVTAGGFDLRKLTVVNHTAR